MVGSAPIFPHGVIDPIPRDRGAGGRARRGLSRRRLPRRVHPAVGGAAGLPGAAVRLPAARRDLDVGRHAQVRLRGQGLVGRAVPGQGPAPVPVLHGRPTGPAGCTCPPPSPAAGPGALSATCWAAMVSIGESGYTEAARRILETGARIRDGIAAIPGCPGARRPAVGDRVRHRRRPRRVPGHGEHGRPGVEPERAAAARRGPHRGHAPAHPARRRRPLPRRPARVGRGGPGPTPGSAPGWRRSTAWRRRCTRNWCTRCWPATSTSPSRSSSGAPHPGDRPGHLGAEGRPGVDGRRGRGGGAGDAPGRPCSPAAAPSRTRGLVGPDHPGVVPADGPRRGPAGCRWRPSPAPPSGRGPCRSTPAASPVRDAIIWMDSRGAPYVRRITGGPVQHPGLRPGQAGPLDAHDRRDPRAERQGLDRAHPVAASTPSRSPTGPRACSWSRRTG